MGDRTRFTLRDGMDLAGIGLEQLWLRYVAIGGSGDLACLALSVLEIDPPDEHEHNLIAQALNEAFIDEGQGTFPVGYSGPVASSRPPTAFRAGGSPARARSLELRRQAALAGLRSAAAAQQAAELHATAAKLMQASGNLRFACRADARAQAARRRGARAVAV
jgi:hypothetical protein